MSITNLDIGKVFTLDNGTDTLEGVLSSIDTTPEIMQNSVSDTRGDYKPKWKAGTRTITLDVQATDANDDSPILSDISGAFSYNIAGDVYTISVIVIEGTKNSRVAFITLVHNQFIFNPIKPDKVILAILHVDDNAANDYTLTSIIKGTNLGLKQVRKSGLFYELTLSVYKYSNDDKFINDIITNNTFLEKGITVTQNYEKNGNTETETFKSEKVVKLYNNLPDITINDLGNNTEIIEYNFEGSIERYLTA